MTRVCSIVGVLLAACVAGAEPGPLPSQGLAPGADPWAGVRFLAGEWVGEGSGRPGEGSGTFSFRFDLDGRVLVRRDHSEYPASPGRPATVHDALMVVYPRPNGGGHAAVYFDNERHVIRYDVGVSADGGTVVFLSTPAPGSRRYRLTYERVGADEVEVTFEVAPPGEPPAFKTYIAGRSRRVGR